MAAGLNGRSPEVGRGLGTHGAGAQGAEPGRSAGPAAGAGRSTGAAALVVGKTFNGGRGRKPEGGESVPAGRCMGTAANSFGGAAGASGAR